jgi:hypothetical protein
VAAVGAIAQHGPVVGHSRGDYVSDLPMRTWRELASDWKVWLCIVLCLLIAAITSLLGYD